MEEMSSNLATYGYIGLFIYSLGGGYMGIIAAGIMSHLGKMDISLSISIAIFSNFLGDQLLFYMGRYNKKDIHNFLIKQRRKLALAHILLKRYGDSVIFFQKYIYGIKTLIPIAVGLTKYSMHRFMLLNALAAIIWGVSIGLTSFFSGALLVPIVNYLGTNYYLILIFLALTVFLTWFYMNKVTKKK